MITVHHLRIGRPLFTLWLIEELGIDYELKVYDRNEMGRAAPELKDVHPLGKSPVIVDDGHESSPSPVRSPCTWLRTTTAPGASVPPTDKMARATWYQWFHYTEASAFAPLADHAAAQPGTGSEAAAIQHVCRRPRSNCSSTTSPHSLGEQAYILGD
jgi:glutathione S-transferase